MELLFAMGKRGTTHLSTSSWFLPFVWLTLRMTDQIGLSTVHHTTCASETQQCPDVTSPWCHIWETSLNGTTRQVKRRRLMLGMVAMPRCWCCLWCSGWPPTSPRLPRPALAMWCSCCTGPPASRSFLPSCLPLFFLPAGHTTVAHIAHWFPSDLRRADVAQMTGCAVWSS